MLLLEPRSNHSASVLQITVGIFSFVLLALLVVGMVLCWNNPQIRRWIGDCAPWRRKQRLCKGLGIEGAGDLEGARDSTPNLERDLRSELHTPTYSELAREKELRRGDAPSHFSSLADLTIIPVPEVPASVGSPRPSLSRTERALRYVTKDSQHYLFPVSSKPEKRTPSSLSAPSPRKFSFRSARSMKKGIPGTQLTISAPVYGAPTLTLSLPPTMTLSWVNYEPTISGSESSEPSPTTSLPFTDCAETLSSVDSEEVATIDFNQHLDPLYSRRNLDGLEPGMKRLSVASQISGLSIMSTDTGKVSFAQVAMRPESKPQLQIIGPCESPRRVVMHYD